MSVFDWTTTAEKTYGSRVLQRSAQIRIRSICGLAPVLMIVVVGCGAGIPRTNSPVGTTEMQEPSELVPAGTIPEDDPDESAGDLREHHRHHHHGGFAMFVAMSLDLLDTTPEQATALNKIQGDMYAKMQPAYDAEKHLLSSVADGVAAGKIDKGKVDLAIAQLSAAAGQVHEAVADSLNQLHAVLEPQQRMALVDKISAHFEVWDEVNSADESAERDAHGGHLGRVAKELGLSPDQVEKSRANFKASVSGTPPHFDRKEAEEYMTAFGKAFAGDAFDARTLGTAANAHIATWGATRMARLYEAVVPVLTPEQRAKLADVLRRHSNYHRTLTGN
jgi:Spy/CpxP family protein refolding chaperone